jgi:drug/metabolite transporter (DMT)-like permease
MNSSKKYWYHLAAIVTVIVWGVTFVSTKVLIDAGLSPIEICLYRFVLAYAGLIWIAPRKLFANNIKDELLLMSAGVSGGSVYFILENTALETTFASNVSLLVSTAPIFTALLTAIVFKGEKFKKNMIIGSLVAIAGVALVVFNGRFILHLSPIGDTLSILAAILWAFYGVTMRVLGGRYTTAFITRKVFFYGIITLLPFLALNAATFKFSALSDPAVLGNLLFLGVIASLLCYLLWNGATIKLGVVQTSNYIYLVPPVTLLSSSLLIHERITLIAVVGCVMIILGLYLAEHTLSGKRRRA